MSKLVILILLLFLIPVFPVLAAESTVSCHCFTDRSFDHQHPEKVVPYFLATSQNSLLALAFNANKFTLVKELMSGVPSEQLWIAHYFAASTGLDAKLLLQMRQQRGSWGAVQEVAAAAAELPPTMSAALQAGDDDQLAAEVVDGTLVRLLKADVIQLQQLRAAGADNRATILSCFFAARTDKPATEVNAAVAAGATNWGTLAYVNNVMVGEMETEFQNLLR